jgi:hypothetical protein
MESRETNLVALVADRRPVGSSRLSNSGGRSPADPVYLPHPAREPTPRAGPAASGLGRKAVRSGLVAAGVGAHIDDV